jgi:hypothetical protein
MVKNLKRIEKAWVSGLAILSHRWFLNLKSMYNPGSTIKFRCGPDVRAAFRLVLVGVGLSNFRDPIDPSA